MDVSNFFSSSIFLLPSSCIFFSCFFLFFLFFFLSLFNHKKMLQQLLFKLNETENPHKFSENISFEVNENKKGSFSKKRKW